MKVAYYYNQGRFPKGDSRTNPYGPSLAEALEELGVEFEFSEQLDWGWLMRRRKEIQILHLNWPSYEYKRARREDGLIVVFWFWLAFISRLAFARLLGYKVVWTMHNLYPHNARFRLLDLLCRRALCWLCNGIIVHCQHARDLAAQHFRRTKRVYVIPHGHFAGVYPNKVSRQEAREQLGIPQANFVYLLFGSLQRYKGVEELLRTFSGMAGDDLGLIVAGGVYSAYAHTLQPEADRDSRIIFRMSQRTPSEDLQTYYNAADVVVLPFRAVLTSGTVILALSWRKPVIVPALGCLPELMDGSFGVIYDPRDPDGLRKAMDDIRAQDVVAMGERGYRHVSELSWDRIAAQTLRVYQES